MNKWLLILVLWIVGIPVFAMEAVYPFSDQISQARFESLLKVYRCVVCENQTLAESEATLAKDLRSIIYHKIIQGETDEQIDDYLKKRFGDYIEYRPPFDQRTLLLWLGPILLLLIAAIIVWKFSAYNFNSD